MSPVLPRYVQQPLQPYVLSQRSEFRLDACPLDRERPPRGGRALQERDRGVGVALERVRCGRVVPREGLVGTEAHAPIEGFNRHVEQRVALARLTEREMRRAETDVELDNHAVS